MIPDIAPRRVGEAVGVSDGDAEGCVVGAVDTDGDSLGASVGLADIEGSIVGEMLGKALMLG